MASLHDRQFRVSRALNFRQHGIAIAWNGQSVTGIVSTEAERLIEDPASRTRYRNRTVQIRDDETGGSKYGDLVGIPGAVGGEIENWTAHERIGTGGGVTTWLVVRPERMEAGGRRR